MGCSKSSSKREVYSDTAYLRKQENSQMNDLTLYWKHQEKEEQTNPKVGRGKEITKIRAEINETDEENNRKDQWN